MNYFLGDTILPVVDGAKGWYTKKDKVSLQILSSCAPHSCYVEKLIYYNVNPIKQKLALCAFSLEVTNGYFSNRYEAEKIGPCSFVNISDGQENTLQSVGIEPPVLLRRGQSIGMWDADNGELLTLRSWRRFSNDEEYGFFNGSSIVGKQLPLTANFRSCTNWYVMYCKKKEARKKTDVKKVLDSFFAEAFIRECTEDEFELKKAMMLTEPEISEVIKLEDGPPTPKGKNKQKKLEEEAQQQQTTNLEKQQKKSEETNNNNETTTTIPATADGGQGVGEKLGDKNDDKNQIINSSGDIINSSGDIENHDVNVNISCDKKINLNNDENSDENNLMPENCFNIDEKLCSAEVSSQLISEPEAQGGPLTTQKKSKNKRKRQQQQ